MSRVSLVYCYNKKRSRSIHRVVSGNFNIYFSLDMKINLENKEEISKSILQIHRCMGFNKSNILILDLLDIENKSIYSFIKNLTKKNKKIEGIKDLRDESTNDICIVLDLKHGKIRIFKNMDELTDTLNEIIPDS